MLRAASVLEHAALPVLKYAQYFNPAQVAKALRRIRRMGADGNREQVQEAMLKALGKRFAAVMEDCSDAQLAQGLLAFSNARSYHPAVVTAACRHLPQRLAGMDTSHMASAVSALASMHPLLPGDARPQLLDALAAVAEHLSDPAHRENLLTQPHLKITAAVPQLPPQQPASSSMTAGTAAAGPGAAGPQQQVAPLSHRSVLRLAWAFAAARVRHEGALQLLATAGERRILDQLQAHDPAAGPLQPRATYRYRCIKGWEVWPAPRPAHRQHSRYLRDTAPRVALRDFTLSSLGALLGAFSRLGYRHPGLLEASSLHVGASLPAGSGAPSLARPLPPATARRLLSAYRALGYSPPATAALARATDLAALPARQLVAAMQLCADAGVRDRVVYLRLLRALTARFWIPGSSQQLDASRKAWGKRAAGAGAGRREQRWAAAAGEEGAAGVGSALVPFAGVATRRDDGVATREQLRARAAAARRPKTEHEIEEEVLEEFKFFARRPEDYCNAGDLARALTTMAKIGFKETPSSPSLMQGVKRMQAHLAMQAVGAPLGASPQVAADVALAGAKLLLDTDVLVQVAGEAAGLVARGARPEARQGGPMSGLTNAIGSATGTVVGAFTAAMGGGAAAGAAPLDQRALARLLLVSAALPRGGKEGAAAGGAQQGGESPLQRLLGLLDPAQAPRAQVALLAKRLQMRGLEVPPNIRAVVGEEGMLP